MSEIVISGAAPLGALSNKVPRLFDELNGLITRLQGDIAAAASGYSGTSGTEYEGGDFGVVASATPGAQGLAYAYAFNSLATNWATFVAANQAFITALDNG